MNTITAHVEIHPEQLAGALSPATLAKALFEKLTASAEASTLTPLAVRLRQSTQLRCPYA